MSKNLWYAVKSFTCLWTTSHLESRANIEIIISYKSYDLHTINSRNRILTPFDFETRCKVRSMIFARNNSYIFTMNKSSWQYNGQNVKRKKIIVEFNRYIFLAADNDTQKVNLLHLTHWENHEKRIPTTCISINT